MNALIIGANGQDGYYLQELLKKKNINVTGISRSGGFLNIDITNFFALKQIIKDLRPAYIFHLAANSTTSHAALFDNHDSISTGVINLLEAIKEVSHESKVFISGSGLQFVNNDLPIKESDPFDASSAYSVARIHTVYAARYYRTLGLKVYVGYFFNHESPRRTERHISKMISEAVKRIRHGSQEKIQIGDMSVKKEWTFAGDVVEGVMKMVEQDECFECVIGSGEGFTIEEYIAKCFAYISKDWKQFVVEKPGFVSIYKQLVSDPSTLKSLGWTPTHNLDDLVKMMVDS